MEGEGAIANAAFERVSVMRSQSIDYMPVLYQLVWF